MRETGILSIAARGSLTGFNVKTPGLIFRFLFAVGWGRGFVALGIKPGTHT